jgi:2-dehydro-3-deoxyphosphooctonate aldolase (KDO 8-P synthase)
MIKLGKINIGNEYPLVLIAGPCVIESEQVVLNCAEKIKKIADKIGVPFIFKSSFDKANRSAVDYYRGPGMKKGLQILAKVKKEFGLNVVTDVHCSEQIKPVSEIVDIIQIPAYLCQQTDLVVNAAKTMKPLNIKKGQFIAPWDMDKIAKKAKSTGNDQIMITERGTVFGYNNLVCDMRSIPVIRGLGYPVFVDVTHIVRMPGPPSADVSGKSGQPEFIPVLANAAVAAGCDGLFLEIHPEPENALCDAASMLHLNNFEPVLRQVYEISKIIRKVNHCG